MFSDEAIKICDHRTVTVLRARATDNNHRGKRSGARLGNRQRPHQFLLTVLERHFFGGVRVVDRRDRFGGWGRYQLGQGLGSFTDNLEMLLRDLNEQRDVGRVGPYLERQTDTGARAEVLSLHLLGVDLEDGRVQSLKIQSEGKTLGRYEGVEGLHSTSG